MSKPSCSRIRVNVGCGATPTQGWVNLDNSLTVRIAPLIRALASSRLVSTEKAHFAAIARAHRIRWCNAAKTLPFPSNSVDTIYTSHMVEHLGRSRVCGFLAEARRVLVPGGIFRIAVPDLSLFASVYSASGDADAFVARTRLTSETPHLLDRIKWLVIGSRHHQWMYDARSLCLLLGRAGFANAQALPAGVTRIHAPGALNLEERRDESCYVECNKP